MLLEVLNGKSSIIRGSLVLEPAAHSRETLEELPKKRRRKEEEKLDSSSTLLLLSIFHPYLQLVVNQINFAKFHQFTWTVTISKCFRLFDQNSLSDKVTFAEYCQSQSHCFGNNDKIAVTLKCVVLCSAAKPEKCEICLAGFPANDGVNFPQMMARICANCWLSHFQLNRCVKTTSYRLPTQKLVQMQFTFKYLSGLQNCIQSSTPSWSMICNTHLSMLINFALLAEHGLKSTTKIITLVILIIIIVIVILLLIMMEDG